MGEATTVNSSTPPLARPRPLRLSLDIPLFLALVFLLGFGLLMVYSASWMPSAAHTQGRSVSYFFTNQIKWAIVGSVIATLLMYFDYRRFYPFVLWMMGATIVLLLAVLIFGQTLNYSRRTLLGGSIQPAELAKLVTILYLAVWLQSKREVLNKITFGLLPLIFILGLVAGLILLEPDISTALTILAIGGLLFFLAGVDLRQILLIILVVGVVAVFVTTFSSTGQTRIRDFIAGLQDPLAASYHIQRAQEAVVRGGILGVGIGEGTTKLTSLPLPHHDSIFAVIVEETGLVGASLLIAAYLVVLWRGLLIARRAPDMAGALIAAGISLWITLEALMNILAMLNLLPATGNVLPFVSIGGSSLVTTLAGVGLLMSVARVSAREQETTERRIYGAVVSLRRGDRRRRVSRPRHPSGIGQ